MLTTAMEQVAEKLRLACAENARLRRVIEKRDAEIATLKRAATEERDTEIETLRRDNQRLSERLSFYIRAAQAKNGK